MDTSPGLSVATQSAPPRALFNFGNPENVRHVTLLNWRRLTNTPVQFNVALHVQALVWKEYVAVISNVSSIHLYHLKHGFWSQLPVNSQCSDPPMSGCPFAVYNGDLVFVANSSRDIYKLDTSAGTRWVKFKDDTVTAQVQQQPAVPGRARGGIQQIPFHGLGGLGSSATPVRSCILISASIFGESLILLEADSQNPCLLATLQCFIKSRWSQAKALQTKIDSQQPAHPIHLSFGIVPDYMYVSNGTKIFQLHVSAEALKKDIQIKVTEISPTPLSSFTIACVDDTLFSFGGRDSDNQPSSDVFRYDPHSQKWEPAGYMRNARYLAIVVPVQDQGQGNEGTTKIVVIGGCLGETGLSSTLVSRVTEMCDISI